MRKVTAVVVVASVLTACAGRGPIGDVARQRAIDLGLGGRERAAFVREVAACVRREQGRRQSRAPTSTVAVGVSGEAPGGSAVGLAAVGVMASTIAAGMAHRWWKRGGDRAARPAEQGATAGNAARPSGDAVRADTPVATADGVPPDAPESVVNACLATVSARWQAAGAQRAAP